MNDELVEKSIRYNALQVVENIVFPKAVLKAHSVQSHTVKHIMNTLIKHSDATVVSMSQKELATKSGLSIGSVKRAFNVAKEVGLIFVKHQYRTNAKGEARRIKSAIVFKTMHKSVSEFAKTVRALLTDGISKARDVGMALAAKCPYVQFKSNQEAIRDGVIVTPDTQTTPVPLNNLLAMINRASL